MPPSSRHPKRSRPPTSEPQSNDIASTADAGESSGSASHLISFLTSYADRDRTEDLDRYQDGAGSSSEDNDDEDGDRDQDYDEDEEDDVDREDDDDEDEKISTPSRRKTGLVGSASTPGSSKSTPKRTVARKRVSSNTPRKRKAGGSLGFGDHDGEGPNGDEGDGGIIRFSKSDGYFLMNSKSAKTSGNSYAALVKPLSQSQYELYANGARSKVSTRFMINKERTASKTTTTQIPSTTISSSVSVLTQSLTFHFPQWLYELESGFNLLLYGFGSKRRLVNSFARSHLSNHGHVVITNGHFPQLGIRDLLSQIEDCLSVPQDIPIPPSLSTPLDRSAHRIYAYFLNPESIKASLRQSNSTSNQHLYLVIHNIDSPTLRTPRSVGILSLLASCPRIHMIATFDHVNSPLLFSSTLSNSPPHTYQPGSWSGTPHSSRGFNWIYHNATTYDDYDVELTYQRLSATSSLATLASTSSGISEEGALQILRSVPPMALRLLKLLLTRQLSSLPPESASHSAHPATPVAPSFAIDNDILQTLAREKFIAREEERFNALIGEFKDHGLVVQAELDEEGRTGRWVWVPLGKAAIERVLVEMKDIQV